MGRWAGLVVVVGLGSLVAGCAHGAAAVHTAAVLPVAAPVDTVARTIATADAHLAAGIEQSTAGHLNKAREEFDSALDLYVDSPGGALAEPRLAAAYRRTLESIQLHEFETLAAVDGFKESQPEPASIDEVGGLRVDNAPVSDELRRTAEGTVRDTAGDLAIDVNDAVLGCIDLYQGPLRDWFQAALARGSRYLPHIREVFASEGIPQDLAYVALVESAFKTGALSRAKAKGMWQFIPETGRRFGLQQDWWLDERSNPEKATRAAAQYLHELHDNFRDWNLALAAYNAGEGRVARSIDRQGTENFWELAEANALARETRNYVPMIHAAILVAKEPGKYGFDVTADSQIVSDTVTVRGAIDLRLVAECANESVGGIQGPNPELRRLATPAGRTYGVKVPSGSGETTQRCLDSVPAERRVTFRTHTLSKGQTLASVARMYGARAQDIASANGLLLAKKLARGTELIIPIPPPSVPTARGRAETRTVSVSGRGAVRTASARVRVNYRIRSGDTLMQIASRYDTTVQQLMSWNKGLRPTRLAAGDTLRLYARRAD